MTVRLIPDLLHVMTLRSSVEDLDGLPVINLRESPLVGWAGSRSAPSTWRSACARADGGSPLHGR